MFCRNCGKQLPDGARFCGNCGTPAAAPAGPWMPGPVPEAGPAQADEPAGPVMEESPAPEEVPEESPAEAVEEQPAAEAPAEPPVERAEEAPAGAPVESAAGTPAEGVPEMPEESPAGSAAPADGGQPEAEAQAESPSEAADRGQTAAPVNMPKFDIPYTEPQAADGAAPARGRNRAVFAVIGVGAAVLIALVAVGIWMITRLVGGGGKILCVYLNDEGELMYLPSLKEDTKAVEITDEADYGADVQFSRDGKTVYFRDVDGALYQIAAADLEKDGGKPDRIARNVSGYQVLDKGRLLYFESGGTDEYFDSNYGAYRYREDYKVSLYEDGQSSRLVKSCEDWSVSEDETTLYYTEQNDGDGTYTLYKMGLSRDGQEEELLDGWDILYTGYDAETLVYGVRSEGKADEETGRTDGNTLTVYSAKPGEKGTRLVSGIYTAYEVTAEGGKVSFYYMKEDVEKHTLYDFVTDAGAGADAAILQGDMPSYPSWYGEYYPEELYLEGGQVYCMDAKGDSYPVDLQPYQADTGLSAEELYDMYYWDILYGPAYDDAYARYEEAEQAYYDWYGQWEAADSREQIRQDLKATRRDQTSYTLLRYTGDRDGETVATGLRSSYAEHAGDMFVYQKTEGADVKKVADVAELDYSYQVYDLLDNGGTGGYDWYQNAGGKESPLDLDEEDVVYGLYQLSDKEVVLWLSDGDEDRLDSYAVGADGLTLSDTVYEGALSLAGTRGEPGGKTALYLFTETEEDNNYNMLGDFSVYRDGKLETIAKEVYGAVVLDESGDTYVFTDVDSEYNIELAVLQDGKPVTISDEVSGGSAFLDGGRLLYLSDSDLYLWDGKESRRVARDVEYLWVSYEEPCRWYNP